MGRASVWCRALVAGGVLWSLSLGAMAQAQEAVSAEPVTLRVATKSFVPFVIPTEEGFSGFSIELWELLAEELGVQTEWVATESVRELLGAVRSDEADLAIAGITITAEREQSVDFSHSFYESGLQVLVSSEVQEGGGFLRALLSNDLLEVVGLLFICILIAAHLIWFTERKRSPESYPRGYLEGIWQSFWWASVTVTTVGYGDKVPRGPAGRIVAMVWMFMGLLLISYFTATVTTALTLERLEGSIRGPADLPGKRVAAPKGTTAARYLNELGANLVAVGAIEEAYTALVNGEVEAVVYDAPVLRYHANREGRGKVRVVGPRFKNESYGIALQEGSAFRERVSRALLDLRESGRYSELYARWFGAGE